jgi:hypothetical protein
MGGKIYGNNGRARAEFCRTAPAGVPGAFERAVAQPVGDIDFGDPKITHKTMN